MIPVAAALFDARNMATQEHPAASGFVETWAGRVKEPLVRLRFLRLAARLQEEHATTEHTIESLAQFLVSEARVRPTNSELREAFAELEARQPKPEVVEPPPPAPRKRKMPRTIVAVAAAAAAVVLVVLLRDMDLEASPAEDDFAMVSETIPTEPAGPVPEAERTSGEVWLVSSEEQIELYSNGLRVSNEFLTHTGPREYAVFPRGPGVNPEDIGEGSRPVGVVYHVTHSELAPMGRDNTNLILRQGRKLLNYIRTERLYNFVIDRFGQVHRIIPETEYAFHAGYSTWSHGASHYCNLNTSFIGVSFETSLADRDATTGAPVATDAQVTSARLLTQMIRDRFAIPAELCITHEMVSIAPKEGLIGYHTDWAGRFPFARLGLPDNYQTPMPAISEWGFRYDRDFVKAIGGEPWAGVQESVRSLRTDAKRHGLSERAYRSLLQRKFQQYLSRTRALAPQQSWADQVRQKPRG